MDCVGSGSMAVTERPDLTAQGYRRFRCRGCGEQFNERSDGVLNRASLPSDIIAFVVFCRLRYRLTLRDLSEIMLLRGLAVSHELYPAVGEEAAAGDGRGVAQAASRHRVRWTPPVGQFGGLDKLGSDCRQAANFSMPDAQYVSSGVRPSSVECGRRAL